MEKFDVDIWESTGFFSVSRKWTSGLEIARVFSDLSPEFPNMPFVWCIWEKDAKSKPTKEGRATTREEGQNEVDTLLQSMGLKLRSRRT